MNRIGVCTKKKTPPGCAQGHCFLCWIWKRIVTMETTRGCIFSVKRTETSLGTEWCKVSWCLMTRKSGKGSRWKISHKNFNHDTGQLEKTQTHVKKTFPGMYFKEVCDDKNKSICTWDKKQNGPPTW